MGLEQYLEGNTKGILIIIGILILLILMAIFGTSLLGSLNIGGVF